MNRITATTDNRIVVYTGDASKWEREEGLFEVRTTAKKTQFPTLLAAYLRYHQKDEAASIWDMTDGEVFIESKVIVPFPTNTN